MLIKKFLSKIKRTRRIKRSRPYYRSLKNIHLEKRGFIIGNGPSLKVSDLELLKNEITIASNKIYLAFEQTNWRPSYYTIADQILWPKIKDKLYKYSFNKIHIPSYLESIPKNLLNIIETWNALDSEEVKFSDKFHRNVFGGGSITYENLQLAYHLGINPIYILGCDHNYVESSRKNESVIVTHEEQVNHFHKNYRAEGEKVNSANFDLMNKSYSKTKDFLKNKNIEIFNITRGGKLEIFDRKNFDDVVYS